MRIIRHLIVAVISGLVAGAAGATLPASAHNFTVRLTLTAQHLQPDYGEEHAPEGRQFLVLRARWEDLIDRAFATERNLPVSAKDDNLSDSLSLVIDNADVLPVFSHEVNTANLDANDPDILGRSGGSTDAAYLRKVIGVKNTAGQRSLVYLALPEPGATMTGDLIFSVPVDGKWHWLELRYHDPTGGDFRLPFWGESGEQEAAALEKDPPGTQTNEVFALAVHAASDLPRDVPPAPPGRRYVALDLAGRSLLKVHDAYPPYDPSHPAEAMYWRPDPASWIEFRNMVQLVAEETLPCSPVNAETLPEAAVFRPSPWTHQRLLYLVPTGARALELVCFFPAYTIPGIDGNVTPKPMRFHLAGPAAFSAGGLGKVERKIVDGPIEYGVISHTVAPAFAGEAAAEGERFLLINFSIHNSGDETVEFKPPDQLVWFKPPDAPAPAERAPKVHEKRNGVLYDPAAASGPGEETPPDEITNRGPLAPPAFFYLAAGDTRVFQAVWQVPAGLMQARMGIKGNNVAEPFILPLTPQASSTP